jgi:hypothetical protein
MDTWLQLTNARPVIPHEYDELIPIDAGLKIDVPSLSHLSMQDGVGDCFRDSQAHTRMQVGADPHTLAESVNSRTCSPDLTGLRPQTKSQTLRHAASSPHRQIASMLALKCVPASRRILRVGSRCPWRLEPPACG